MLEEQEDTYFNAKGKVHHSLFGRDSLLILRLI
jgi:hypothetical protein